MLFAAAMLNAGNAYVSEIAHDVGSLEYVVLRPMDWNAISVDRYAALMNEDPRMPAFRGNPYRPLHCRMVVSEKKLHASRTYQEALKPLGIEYTLVVGVPRARDVTNFLGFTRGAGEFRHLPGLVEEHRGIARVAGGEAFRAEQPVGNLPAVVELTEQILARYTEALELHAVVEGMAQSVKPIGNYLEVFVFGGRQIGNQHRGLAVVRGGQFEVVEDEERPGPDAVGPLPSGGAHLGNDVGDLDDRPVNGHSEAPSWPGISSVRSAGAQAAAMRARSQ